MVNPLGQSTPLPVARTQTVAAVPVSASADAEAGDTRSRILDAAFRCLTTHGYAALTVRNIARDAGVNHALISYYFGTKDKLVVAVLDDMNRRLLDRQRSMYAAPGGFAAKWAAARRFYEEDLSSGFVRVQSELYAASLSNAGLREQFLPRVGAWKLVVLEAVQNALATYRPSLPPAFTATAIASMISEFWLGMEFAQLIGGDVERARHAQALDAVEALLVAMERTQAATSARPATKTSRRR